MGVFRYTALNTSGSEIKGTIQAEDINGAALVIRDRGLRVLELKQGREGAGFLGQANFSDWLAANRSVKSASLIFFFRQMAFMLRSGLPVAQALVLAEKQVSCPRMNLTIRLMRKDIESGQALSVAMKKHPDVFPEMGVNLVQAGETTGEIDKIMERLVLHLEKKAALKAQTITAMIYPSIVVLTAIGVGIFMTVKIIPKFAEFLLGQGRVLPASTQALIDFSDYVVANGLYILAAVIAFIITILATYQFKGGRRMIDSLLLRIPVIGYILINSAMAQMAWALSMLLKSGVTVFDALKVTGALMKNRIYHDRLMQASEKILTGRDMATSIHDPQMPILVTQMVAVGESTGSLDRVLQELGEYYEQLLELAIKRMTALIEPVMILVIGSMVGFVYYAFFQALFSLAGG
jgi:type IV pilus assembly protein PilC